MAAEYPAEYGSGCIPAVEATLRIAPRPRSTIAGRKARGERDDRLDQHPDLLELAVGVGLVERPAGGKAGVVDQDLDVEAELGDLTREPRARRGLGEVAGDRLGADAVGVGSSSASGVEAILAAGDEHEAVAARGELAGDRAADPGGGAGDQRG